MIPDILELILQYTDLETYYNLIDNKILTLTKYYKLQDQTQNIYIDRIKKYWIAMNKRISSITNDNFNFNFKKYLYIKNYYNTIKKIIEALRVCNLFVYTESLDNLTPENIKLCSKIIVEKCNLIGYLVGKLDNISYSKEVKISVIYTSQKDNIFMNIIDDSITKTIVPTIKLWNFYCIIMMDFYELLEYTSYSLVNSISNTFDGNYANLLTGLVKSLSILSVNDVEYKDWDEKYEDLQELVNYQNN